VEKFYIRFRGNTRGPYNRDELLQLAERGRFAKHHEVSTDGSTWERAGLRPDLFSKQSPVEAAFSTDDGDAWYYSLSEDQEEGPVSLRDLKSMIRNETLDGDALVWKEGMPDWAPADEVSELEAGFGREGKDEQRGRGGNQNQMAAVDGNYGQACFCTGCGSPIHPNAIACPNCGVGRGAQSGSESGTTALVLALIGLFVIPFFLPFAWYVGSQYLKKCQDQGIQPDGAGVAGRMIGMIFTILWLIFIAVFVLLPIFLVILGVVLGQ